MHVLQLCTKPCAGSDVQRTNVASHLRSTEHRVVDVIVRHVPVELSGLHFHGQQQVGEVGEVHVGCGEGVEVYRVVGVDSLNRKKKILLNKCIYIV